MSVEPFPATVEPAVVTAVDSTSGPGQGEASAGAVAEQVRALLEGLADRAVAEHGEVFADIHGVLQNALSDAGRDPAPR